MVRSEAVGLMGKGWGGGGPVQQESSAPCQVLQKLSKMWPVFLTNSCAAFLGIDEGICGRESSSTIYAGHLCPAPWRMDSLILWNEVWNLPVDLCAARDAACMRHFDCGRCHCSRAWVLCNWANSELPETVNDNHLALPYESFIGIFECLDATLRPCLTRGHDAAKVSWQ